MKTFTFKYVPNEPSIRKRIKQASTGEAHVKPDELISNDLKTLLKLITASRLVIFGVIFSQKPNSVYSLAKKLDKPQPFVLKEVRVLESLGLISLLRELDGGRERLKPVALYSKVVIDCGFSEMQNIAS
jgi:predicted transcriptional regulator